MDSLIQFSVIIPHKNSPELLKRCLASIPDREDIEVLVIDDNSTPNLVDFSNFPGVEKKNLTTFLTKEAKGAGFARNIGITKAKGKWLIFADADDFFTENAFESFSQHKDDRAEIVYFGVSSKNSKSLETAHRHLFYEELVSNFNSDNKDSEFWLRLRFLVPWGKMIKRTLIFREKISFEEIPASNDIMFSVKAGFHAKTINVDPQQVYCVTVVKGSLTNIRSKEISRTRFKVKLRFNDFVREIGKEKYQYALRRPLYDSLRYGYREFIICILLAMRHRTDFLFDLKFKRTIESYRAYKKAERENKFIVRK